MNHWILSSISSVAVMTAGIAYAQEDGVAAGDAAAQAGADGASAQSGSAAAQASPSGAAAQAGSAGASTPSGASNSQDINPSTGGDAAANAAPANAGASVAPQDGLNPGVTPTDGLDATTGAGAGIGTNPTGEGSADLSGRSDANANSNRAALGVTLSETSEAGQVTITNVSPNSPAARMGLQPGDQIVSFEGAEVASTRAFIDAVGRANVSANSEIIVLRNGRRETLQASFSPWGDVYGQAHSSGQPYTAMRPNFDASQPPAAGSDSLHANQGSQFHDGYSWGGGYGQRNGNLCCQTQVVCCQNWSGGRRRR